MSSKLSSSVSPTFFFVILVEQVCQMVDHLRLTDFLGSDEFIFFWVIFGDDEVDRSIQSFQVNRVLSIFQVLVFSRLICVLPKKGFGEFDYQSRVCPGLVFFCSPDRQVQVC